MRLLIATGLYPPESGGPATHTKMLEDALPKHGIEVEVVPFHIVRFLPPIIRHFVFAWYIFRKARHADVLLAQDTVSVGLPSALVARITRVPLIVRVPGDYAWEQGSQRFGVKDTLDEFQTKRYGWRVGLLRSLQRFTVRSAKRVVVPSAYLERIVRSWGVEDRVVLVHNGVDISVDTTRPERPSSPVIVTSARLVQWKGISGLIEAVRNEPSWHLFILGEGPARDSLEREARESGALEHIHFLGSISHAEALGWYGAADVFVLNSTYEGMSHVLVEAMAQGAPIIATAIGGNPELIEHEATGLLVPLNDPSSLQMAIRRMLENKEFAQACGARAKLSSRNFSSEGIVDQWATLLHNI